jgi:protein tyrosine phosphatase
MIPTLETNTFQVRKEYRNQYRDIEAQTHHHSRHFADLAYDQKNIPRNRYGNTLPYQENIFRFLNPSSYFNASRVLQGRAISCQGPLDNEHEHFWKMVWETKTTAVIMLTDLVEGGYEKCSWYLPSEKGETLPSNGELTQEEVIIVNQIDGPPKPTEESSRGSTKLVERVIELEYKGEKRTITHYHFRGWGDFQAAPETTLSKLVMDVWERHYSQGEHIISHCSAGVGRSGTFLATLEALYQLKNSPDLTNLVLNIVKQLRSLDQGRVGMVQNADQYSLIFKTLAILDTNCAKKFCTQNSL